MEPIKLGSKTTSHPAHCGIERRRNRGKLILVVEIYGTALCEGHALECLRCQEPPRRLCGSTRKRMAVRSSPSIMMSMKAGTQTRLRPLGAT